MKAIKRKKTPERLLLGLTLGLAASLCMLEYGKPILDKHVYLPSGDYEEVFATELPPITFPKPPVKAEVLATVIPIQNEFEIVEELPIEVEEDPSDLPSFDIDDMDIYISGDVADAPEIDINIPFVLVEKKPEFTDLEEFLAANLHYPIRMVDLGREGIVGVQFTIGENGEVIDESIKIVRSPHSDFDKEVIRVIKKMPAWSPGEQRGHRVAVTHTLPIRFFLR